ncbi:MAG: hypothetical protein IPK78_10520 [Rhodospirillales bacterium]|nr:hypothetical protein [Rhodospirillales bacterium]
MYMAVPTQAGCGVAWLTAAQKIDDAGGNLYNVVVDIENPATLTAMDRRVIGALDGFLRTHEKLPVDSVANTIIPYALYRKYGAPQFYDVYEKDVYPRVTKPQEWGRYFYRMIHYETRSGMMNPLQRLVEKVRTQVNGPRTYGNVFELPVTDPALDVNTYNAACDGNLLRGGPCLSFLSFKLHPTRGLMLTAMYRNHYFIQRTLGNYIGLGRLQAFVAEEAGVAMGPLTCISTHAELDTGPWGKRDVRRLLQECAAAVSETAESESEENRHVLVRQSV